MENELANLPLTDEEEEAFEEDEELLIRICISVWWAAV
ncbi:hypothetical protein Gohar_021750 [Gossypium harknessii]|uniref:Uncharacterized protein n=1 Tax=Gossypium harknessii TaxID=34285 RepID=A0A7J9IEP2_9ROSI|nr:hypothetical protein [Gossypium harknessii]